MLLYWMFMGFTLHIYIIFGTNLLTEGLAQIVVFFAYFRVWKKRISNGVQTEWNLWECDFLNKRDPGDLEWASRNNGGSHEAGGAPSTLVGPPLLNWRTSSSYIYPRTPQTSRSTTKTQFHRRNLLYPRDPISRPLPELHRRGHWSWRTSTSTPWPLRWCVSILLQTFESIASS